MEPITPERFEEALAKALREGDPRVGLFGPHSKVWEVNRYSLIFLGAGRAALLQLAHPMVALGVAHHSRASHDPLGRFRGTFAQVFPMIFGDLAEVERAARRVYRIHQVVQGTDRGRPYAANDKEALIWVYATLIETSLLIFEQVVRPLSDEEREAYYRESHRFALLFGIFPEDLPPDWAAFRAYFDQRVDHLEVLPVARVLAHQLFAVSPLLGPYRLLTALLLPPRLVEAFGLPTPTPSRRRWQRRVLSWARLWLRFPSSLRELPPYLEAQARLQGNPPTPLVRWAHRLWLGS